MPLLADAILSRTRDFRAPTLTRKSRGSVASLVLFGVPAFLLVLFVWQVSSGLRPADVAVRGAAAVGRAALESDPLGSRIDVVLVDHVGQDRSVEGALNIVLREPDGALWQTTRTVTAADFGPLPAGGLLAGRLGYSLVVPTTDWLRTPRSGGAATITVGVQPSSGEAAFSGVTQERFP